MLETSVACVPPGLALTAPSLNPRRAVQELDDWYREFVCSLSLSAAVATGWTQWASTQASEARKSSDTCFVKTPDCGCRVDCAGANCNGSPAGRHASVSRKLATHGTFNNATALMDKYYDRHLAALVNVWAKPDLALFGYRPWFPGRSLTGRGMGWTGAGVDSHARRML